MATEDSTSTRQCIGVDCENEAGSLQCPTCLKLGTKDSFFCSQDCFKKSWTEHKKVHKSQTTGLFNPFPTFPFTGALRPVYPLSDRREVPKTIQHPDYWRDGVPRSERTSQRNKIEILNKEQQEGMRKVCRLGREVLDIAAAAAKPGVTTDYIDEIVHKACLERNEHIGIGPGPITGQSVTQDGKKTAQFDDGCEILTARLPNSPGGPIPMPVAAEETNGEKKEVAA
ncbi:hypothetical protein EYC84_006162 [Monilinia fructicola]|uniref:C6H2-type domain-containing protein n=1 Tax=Monilinia fructicola TaxID=38448 RepID=A0A5M9K6A0_MONFR|nr:hypothetical protein EYC84_006162 [Monilinia fructicola]